MGGVQSSKAPRTPLAVMLKYFDKGFSGDYGQNAPLDPEVLKDLCERVWVNLGVSWPVQGSLQPQVIANVLKKVESDPTQFPYIHSWQNLVKNNQQLITKCKKRATPKGKKEKKGLSRIFSLSASKHVDYKKRSSGSRGSRPPVDYKSKGGPPVDYKSQPKGGYQPQQMDYKKKAANLEGEECQLRPGASASSAGPDRGERASSSQPSSSSPSTPSLSEKSQDYVGETPSEGEEEAERRKTHQLSHRACPVTTAPREEEGGKASSLSASTPASPSTSTSKESQGYVVEMPSDGEEGTYLRNRPCPVTTAPLHEVIHPDPRHNVSAVRVSSFQVIPFTSSDLIFWKIQTPPYSESPQKMTDLCESIMYSYNPTWQDCEQLLLTLFTREERARIRESAQELLKTRVPIGAPETVWVSETFPLTNPSWDPNTPSGLNRIRTYQRILIEAMHAGIKKPVNLAVPNEIRQQAEESPVHFYDRLLDAYQRFTPLDVSDAANQRIINMAFVAQSWPDIKNYLQRLEGFPGYPISLLLELARSVFEGRDEETKKEQDRKMQRKTQMLAAALLKDPSRTPVLAPQAPQVNPASLHLVPIIAYQQVPVQTSQPAPAQIAPQPAPQLVSVQPVVQPQGALLPVQQYLQPAAPAQVYQPVPQQCQMPQQNVQWCVPPQNQPELQPGPPQVQWNQCRKCFQYGHRGFNCRQGVPAKQHQFNQQQHPGGQKNKRRWKQVQNERYQPQRNQSQRMSQKRPYTPTHQQHVAPVQPSFQATLGGARVLSSTCPVEEKWRLFDPGGNSAPAKVLTAVIPKIKTQGWEEFKVPGVSAEDNPPVGLQPEVWPGNIRQYPLPRATVEGIHKRDNGVIVPIQSPWNSQQLRQEADPDPSCPDFRPAQNLTDTNKETVTLHPTVPQKRVLPQCVDDLLLACDTPQECWNATKELLELLDQKGHKVSQKKAQLCLPQVKYLGYHISQGIRTLGQGKKEAVCGLPEPKTRKQLCGFLGAAGFCRIWIPNFGLTSKPPYESTKGGESDPFVWGEAPSKAFQGLKAGAAAALIIREADKLTLGQKMTVRVPHSVLALLEYKGKFWFTNAHMIKYQAMLCENPRVDLEVSSTLNPATLLPVEGESLEHDCIATMDTVYSSRPDLKDVPLPNAQINYFTDGSSRLLQGIRKTGYAVTTHEQVVEAQPLPPHFSAQRAEVFALTRALQLRKGLCLNVYTDSKYALLTLHAHAALYKECGLSTSGGQAIKHGEEILKLLDAVWARKEVAVIHCRGHQRGNDPIARGNRKADEAAKTAALEPLSDEVLIAPLVQVSLKDFDPKYTEKENLVVQQCSPEATHLGKTALAELVQSNVYSERIHQLPSTASVFAQNSMCLLSDSRGFSFDPGGSNLGFNDIAALQTRMQLNSGLPDENWIKHVFLWTTVLICTTILLCSLAKCISCCCNAFKPATSRAALFPVMESPRVKIPLLDLKGRMWGL